jgi:hypothetical protein
MIKANFKFQEEISDLNMTKEPVFLTICDAGSPKVDTLHSSLHGNLRLLETYCSQLGSLSKIFKIQDFLNTDTTIPDDNIIVFTDAYDVACLRYDPQGLTEDFKATGKDLIVGAETVFAHHSSEVLPFFLSNYLTRKAKYMNSGFIIGYKWAYRTMLNYICDNFENRYRTPNNFSDQRVLSKFMLDNSQLQLLKMDIDSDFKFCYTHTYDNNPLDCKKISSYFIHITWLALSIQAEAWENMKEFYGLSSVSPQHSLPV